MTLFHSKLVRWAVPEKTPMNNGFSASLNDQNVERVNQGTKASSNRNKTHTTMDTKAKNTQREKATLFTDLDYKDLSTSRRAAFRHKRRF